MYEPSSRLKMHLSSMANFEIGWFFFGEIRNDQISFLTAQLRILSQFFQGNISKIIFFKETVNLKNIITTEIIYFEAKTLV